MFVAHDDVLVVGFAEGVELLVHVFDVALPDHQNGVVATRAEVVALGAEGDGLDATDVAVDGV